MLTNISVNIRVYFTVNRPVLYITSSAPDLNIFSLNIFRMFPGKVLKSFMDFIIRWDDTFSNRLLYNNNMVVLPLEIRSEEAAWRLLRNPV